MKKFLSLGCMLAALFSSGFSAENPKEKYSNSFVIRLTNDLNISRNDELIFVHLVSILKKFPHFNPRAYALFQGDSEIASQVDDTDRDGTPDLLSFVVDFSPKEKKTITVSYDPAGSIRKEYRKRTQAELSMKVDYELIAGKYTKGRFVPIDSVRIPSIHADHDGLFMHEGPGWESDKVGYRFYLDARNRTDIFGKKIPDMIMHTVGVHDLVADNNESYESMMNWGMDNFKVGTSLGIGSIAMPQGNEIVTVSTTDSVFCVIAANGPVRSDVRAAYYGWNAGGKKYSLVSNYSIGAGSRLTEHDVTIQPVPESLCTGLAKHDHTVLIEPSTASTGWRYLGLYGKQSRTSDTDEMGIALFYKSSELLQRRDDDVSHLVVLRPTDGKLTYYFAAAWDMEAGGVKTLEEFRDYLEMTVMKFDNPIEVRY